jgi:hypothetical protein
VRCEEADKYIYYRYGGCEEADKYVYYRKLYKAAWQQETIEAMEKMMHLKTVDAVIQAKAPEEGTVPILPYVFLACCLFVFYRVLTLY